MLTVSYSYADGRQFTVAIADNATPQQQTAAIQSALTAVANNGGGAVSLSAGTWTVAGTGKAADGCLKIGSNTTLEGAGSGQTVLKLADGSSAVTGIIRTDSGKSLPDGSFTTVDNVAIKNLSIDGNSAKTTGEVDGFYCGPKPGTAQADTNITLSGVEIMSCSRYGFDPHEQTVGLTFRDCKAHHNGVDGFTIDACSQVTIENCEAYVNGRHGFNIVTGSKDVTMIGNASHDNGGSGISVQTGDNEIREWTDDITISGGSLVNNGRAGIEAKHASGLDISGVVISGNDMDGIILAGVRGADVRAIVFDGNGGIGGVRVDGYLQDFNDSDPLNDRWISSTGIIVNGVPVAGPSMPSGYTAWDYSISAGDDTITGSAGRDIIASGSGNDTVNGGNGADTLLGNDGHDSLDGGAGDDKLYGQRGDDRLMWSGGLDLLDGGSGFDTVEFSKASAAVQVNLVATGYEAMMGTTALADLVSIENLKGSSYADTLLGNGSANSFDGGGGADTLDGGAGADILIGGAGNDGMIGGTGDDRFTGGTGSDQFVFAAAGFGRDTITDFTKKQDKIVLSHVVNFSDLVISQVGTDAVIKVGNDQITLLNMTASQLAASDFLLG